jgi:hypothetical protein
MDPNIRKAAARILVGLVLASQFAPVANALDVEPRRWSHLPVDAHFIGVAFVHTDANIFLDPALELENVEMDLDTWAMKYIYSFDSFGKSSRIDVTQAYQEGHWSGLLQGLPAQTSRQGLSDTFVRYAVNLYGAPPLKSGDYVAYRREHNAETIIGAGLAIRLPTGDYHANRLINLGQNRYTIRPQLGIQHNRGAWTFEANTELAFFTENDDFFNGSSLEQDPLLVIYATAAYTFRPGLWAGIGYGYDYGGKSKINGVDKNNRQENNALAISLAYPLSPLLGASVSYIKTKTQQATGLDSDSLTAGLTWRW